MGFSIIMISFQFLSISPNAQMRFG
jgi:hypothetical protein